MTLPNCTRLKIVLDRDPAREALTGCVAALAAEAVAPGTAAAPLTTGASVGRCGRPSAPEVVAIAGDRSEDTVASLSRATRAAVTARTGRAARAARACSAGATGDIAR